MHISFCILPSFFYLCMVLWNSHILYVLLQSIAFCGLCLTNSLVGGYCIAFNFTVSGHEMNVVSCAFAKGAFRDVNESKDVHNSKTLYFPYVK